MCCRELGVDQLTSLEFWHQSFKHFCFFLLTVNDEGFLCWFPVKTSLFWKGVSILGGGVMSITTTTGAEWMGRGSETKMWLVHMKCSFLSWLQYSREQNPYLQQWFSSCTSAVWARYGSVSEASGTGVWCWRFGSILAGLLSWSLALFFSWCIFKYLQQFFSFKVLFEHSLCRTETERNSCITC